MIIATSDNKSFNQDELNEGIVFSDIYKQSNRKNCAILPYKGILNAISDYENNNK